MLKHLSKHLRSTMVALSIIALVLTACQSSSEAVMYRGGPQRTGVYDTQAVPEFTGVKWKFETGDEI